jgi:N-acetylglutamate synthase-like GNAT family acetyltransferase
MSAFADEKKPTTVREIRTGDLRGLLRLIEVNWRVQLRLSPNELSTKIKHIPSFLAEDGVGIRGFMMMEPSSANLAVIVAVGLRDTWRVKPFLDLMLPRLQQTARDLNLKGLIYIGNATWLSDELAQRALKPVNGWWPLSGPASTRRRPGPNPGHPAPGPS